MTARTPKCATIRWPVRIAAWLTLGAVLAFSVTTGEVWLTISALILGGSFSVHLHISRICIRQDKIVRSSLLAGQETIISLDRITEIRFRERITSIPIGIPVVVKAVDVFEGATLRLTCEFWLWAGLRELADWLDDQPR